MSEENKTAKEAAAKAAALKAKRDAAASAGPAPAAPSTQAAAPQSAAPQAPAAPTHPAPTNPAPTNPAPTDLSVKNTAIIALVLAFVIPIVGIILGHIQLNTVKRTGVGSDSVGLLKGALAVGYVLTGLTLLAFFAAIGIFFAAVSQIPGYY